MKSLLCVVLSIAIAILGLMANSLRKERAAQTPDHAPFDASIRERIALSERKWMAILDEHLKETNELKRVGLAKRNEMAASYGDQIDALEQKIKDKEESNRKPPCPVARSVRECVPGLYRFDGPHLQLMSQDGAIPYLKGIKLNNSVCEISYSNGLAHSVKPDLLVRFYTQTGEALAEVHDKWRFSSISSGETCTEKEGVSAQAGDAYWVRLINLKKGED